MGLCLYLFKDYHSHHETKDRLPSPWSRHGRDVMVAERYAATYDDRSDSEYCNVLFAKIFTLCRQYIDTIYK